VLGGDAFKGGLPIAFLGLLFHFFIATSFAAFYFLIYPRVKFLSTQKVIAGLLYGIFVWIVMNLLILPLTLIPQSPFEFYFVLRNVIVLMLMIGLPVSFLAHRYYSK
jgi:uncharacterized membrane protein YagU involved in acid resistance